METNQGRLDLTRRDRIGPHPVTMDAGPAGSAPPSSTRSPQEHATEAAWIVISGDPVGWEHWGPFASRAEADDFAASLDSLSWYTVRLCSPEETTP